MNDNLIYHLEVKANSTNYGTLIERNSYISEVFSTLELAKEKGVKWLNEITKDICEGLKYCTQDASITIEELLEDKEIEYYFRIAELDPKYADNFEPPEYEYQCMKMKPSSIVRNYDLKGNIISTYWEYMAKKGGWGYVVRKEEEDNLPDAGTKFKKGDFVTINKKEFPKNQVWVVYYTPHKNDPERYFENVYTLSTIEGNKFMYDHDFHESELKKYTEEISENSPLMLLSRIYKEEIKVSRDIIGKIETGEIVLNENPSFRDIEELKYKE